MATYCMSDIHGRYDEFREMLDLIRFSDNDFLYVLGDAVDRGPKSAACLLYIYENSVAKGGNIDFLLGNHEIMLIEVLRRLLHLPNKVRAETSHTMLTAAELSEAMSYDKAVDNFLPWLENCGFYRETSINGQLFLMSHAGYNPSYLQCHMRSDADVANSSTDRTDFDGFFATPTMLSHGLGCQTYDDLVWPYDWIQRTKAEDASVSGTIIHGHLPIQSFTDTMPDYFCLVDVKQKHGIGHIAHHGNSYDIDCGAGTGNRLASLRLDDLEEFYVEIDKTRPIWYQEIQEETFSGYSLAQHMGIEEFYEDHVQWTEDPRYLATPEPEPERAPYE